MLETNLEIIANKSITNANENDEFVAFLKNKNPEELDDLFVTIQDTITPQIDCTQCGNCCKTLMINVEPIEANIAAQYLQMSNLSFEEKYIEKSLGGKMLINAIPCHFLNNNKCSIYLQRFAGCKEFPALHLPQTQKRLFTIMMHYGRCPIVYNVVETIKNQYNFIWVHK
jgi:uncharacterized protein